MYFVLLFPLALVYLIPKGKGKVPEGTWMDPELDLLLLSD